MYAQLIPSSSPVKEAALTVRTILAAARADEIPATRLADASLALLRATDALDASDERVSDELELHAEMIRQGRYHELVEFDAWAADRRALALAA
jgi:hypothetical protein